MMAANSTPGFARLETQLVAALRAHLAGDRKAPIPEAGRLIWRMFAQLSVRRSFGASGPNPISFTEIAAFCDLHRWRLEEHHIELLCALDDAWLEDVHARRSRSTGKTLAPPTSARPLSPNLFDIMAA